VKKEIKTINRHEKNLFDLRYAHIKRINEGRIKYIDFGCI
jgi:hypothetical protein